MSKILFGLLFLFFSSTVLAQTPTTTKPIMVNTGTKQSLLKATAKHWIELFSAPGFKGQSAVYAENGETTAFQKKLSNISFKLSPNTVAYLTINCTDIPTEIMVTETNSNFTIPDMGGICGIRLDERAAICIKFNGVETQIHNNDCKRVTGNISVSVSERQVDGSFVSCFNKAKKRESVFLNAAQGTVPNYGTFVYNTSTEPPFQTVRNFDSQPAKPVQDSFIVGKAAIRDRKIFVKVNGFISTEHKQADLSSDYTKNVIARNINDEFQINRLPFFNLQSVGKSLIAGPYKAMGSEPGGPGYIISKQIRLFFAVMYDFSISGE